MFDLRDNHDPQYQLSISMHVIMIDSTIRDSINYSLRELMTYSEGERKIC